MKLTKRERTLIGILLGIVFFYGYFYFLINPQLSKISKLKADKALYQSDFEKNQQLQQVTDKIETEYRKLDTDINQIVKKYFPSIPQEELIVLLNQCIEYSNISAEQIAFSPLHPVKIADYELNVSTVTIPFQGDYDAIADFLKRLREYEKEIIVKNLSISEFEEDLLAGNIILDIYSIPDNPVAFTSLMVEKERIQGIENPFLPFEGYVDPTIDTLPSIKTTELNDISNVDSKLLPEETTENTADKLSSADAEKN